MSLDIYLTMPGSDEETEPIERIFIRRDGATVEVTRDEWDELYPDRSPVAVAAPVSMGEVFEANITHNLGKMAGEAGIYNVCWRPEENGITHARQLIEPLRDGLAELQSDPERFKQFNPANGWGDYELLVSFTANYLGACERWPEAEVRAWA